MENQANNTTKCVADVNSNFTSFYKDNNIEIPLIQRDYVQGSNSQAEKRDAFIDALYAALLDESHSCELDFIYGTYDHEAFMPLDGQQRLTTLYLLHWFLMNRCRTECLEKYTDTMKGRDFESSDFSYKTRRSSTSFCQKLKTYKPAVWPDSISDTIKGQTWFSESWKQDPSVMAMLDMLDALNRKFNQLDTPDEFQMLERLTHTKAINFDCLDMGTYKLTDSLYVKMNARGKQLTEFENWKAKFIQYVEENYEGQKFLHVTENLKNDFENIKDYFTHSIEHEWTDLIWTYAVSDYRIRLSEYEQLSEEEKDLSPEPTGPLIDSFFLNFYYYIYRIRFFLTEKEEDSDDDSSIHGTESSRKALFKDVRNIEFLFCALDTFVQIDLHNTEKVTGFFNELFYLEGLKTDGSVRLFASDTTNLFESCIRNEASVDEQILLFCIIRYCMEHRCYTVTDELKKYVRVCRNLLESITQRLTKDMKMHSNVRFSQLPKYVATIEHLCSIKDITQLPSFKAGMGDVTAAHLWMGSYPNGDIYQLEDSSYTHGSMYAFDYQTTPSVIRQAFDAFKSASDLERVRLLVAFGYRGTDFGGCAHGTRRFLGYKDRWDVLFRYKDGSDELKRSFMAFVTEYAQDQEQNIGMLIEDKLNGLKGADCLAYYFLKYDAFANSSLRWVMDAYSNPKDVDGHHFFAVKSDFDIITLPRFSSNPLLGYHTEPYACAVAQTIRSEYPNIYAHMDYTGENKNKAHITFDNRNVQLLCTDKGWEIQLLYQANDKPENRIPFRELKAIHKLCIHPAKGKHYLHITNMDRIEAAIELIKLIYNL